MAEIDTISFSNLDEGAVQVEAKPNEPISADPEVPTPPTTPAASKSIDSSNLEETSINSNSSSSITLAADPKPTSEQAYVSTLEPTKPKKKKSQATPAVDIVSEPENEVVNSSKAKASKSKRKPKKVASIDESARNDTDEDEETAPKAKRTNSNKLKKTGKKADPTTPRNSDDEATTTGLTTPGGKSKNPRLSPEDATKQMVHMLHLMLMQKGGHQGVNWADIGRDLQVEGGMTADTARGRYLRHYEKNMKGKPGDTAPSGEGRGRRKTKAKGKESSEAGPSRKRKRVELSKERVDSNDDLDVDDVMEDVEMPDEVVEEEKPKPVKRTRKKQTAEQKAASRAKAKAKKAEKAAKAARMDEGDD